MTRKYPSLELSDIEEFDDESRKNLEEKVVDDGVGSRDAEVPPKPDRNNDWSGGLQRKKIWLGTDESANDGQSRVSHANRPRALSDNEPDKEDFLRRFRKAVIESSAESFVRHESALISSFSESELLEIGSRVLRKSLSVDSYQLGSFVVADDDDDDDNTSPSPCDDERSSPLTDQCPEVPDSVDDLFVDGANYVTSTPLPTSDTVKKARIATTKPKFLDFITSLNEEIGEGEQRHPDAAKFIKSYPRKKEKLANRIFTEANQTIFGNRLPATIEIRWNKRLTMTAGMFRSSRFKCSQQPTTSSSISNHCKSQSIELSVKLHDSAQQCRDTLLHEMCHAANLFIDKMRDVKHGKEWKAWANRVAIVYPNIAPITVYHDYTAKRPFTYECLNCSNIIERFRKSVDVTKARCEKCGIGTFTLSCCQTAQRPLNSFAVYVKEHYSLVRANGNRMHSEVMKTLSAMYNKTKNHADNQDN